MSDSFLGRWSNRKLQKKAPIEPEVNQPSKAKLSNGAVENDFSKDNNTSQVNDPLQLKNPSSVDNLALESAETNALDSNVSPAIPESAAPSDNPVAEVVSEPVVEPARPSTGEMDTSSDLDKDKYNDEPEPLLSDADMPEIQSLDASSDISAFFNRGVSKTLRNAALKHIFGLSKYNVRDGLNDYDEDYTVFEPLGDTVTCDMKFHKERKEKLEAERLEQERLEQERLLAEAEAEQSKAVEEQEATEDAVASNEENDDVAQEQDETEHVLASSSDEPKNKSEFETVNATDTDPRVATASNEHIDSLKDLDSSKELQDKSERV